MKNFLTIAILTLLFTSCKNYLILPQYTDVNSILHLQKGMALETVNDTLKIEPFDVLTLTEDNALVVQYQYRHPHRIYLYKKETDIFSNDAQNNGYKINMETSQLFVTFKDGRLTSYISTKGLKDGELILLKDNNLSIIKKEQLSSLKQLSNSEMLILNEANELTTLPVNKIGFKSVEMPTSYEKISKSESTIKPEKNKK